MNFLKQPSQVACVSQFRLAAADVTAVREADVGRKVVGRYGRAAGDTMLGNDNGKEWMVCW